MFMRAPLCSIMTCYFREQGLGAHPAWNRRERGAERVRRGGEGRRGGGKEAAGDLSLQNRHRGDVPK